MLILLGLLLLVAGVMQAARTLGFEVPFDISMIVLFVLLVAGIGAIWGGAILVNRHFDDMERLRGALLVAAGQDEPLAADWPRLGAAGAETLDLAAAAARAIAAHRALGGRTDEKLAAVVGAAAEGLLVITDTGLVSLVNKAAMRVLGREAVAVGTSVYAALERDEMVVLEQRVRAAGRAVEVEIPHVDGRMIEALMAPLGAHGGFVISLSHREPGTVNDVEHDLRLHDRPPAVSLAPGAAADWPLEDLPVLVLDSETTGLDVALARIVSLGAARSHGWRLYPHANLDCVVNPGVPIPRQSTAVHGISDAMVAPAPNFAEVWPRLQEMAEGAVVIGHSIGFDLAILRRECERHDIAWRTPPALDTGLLFAALHPKESDITLERLAERFGVEIEGRHTALGDALVTAEIWLALIPRLIDRGVRTYGAARQLSAEARGLAARQRGAGWIVPAGPAETESTTDE
ncbi:MAG: 3'-5' exonuclease [Rhodospirillales bacterium]|nr:MAG: 3'-5' exonuclease [Rhodospirillales bacterium]